MEDTERDTSVESTAKDTIESNRDAFEAVADGDLPLPDTAARGGIP